VEKARSGGGPTFYRGGHLPVSDLTPRQTIQQVSNRRGNRTLETRDPFVRLRLYLKGKSLWNEEAEERATEEGQKQIDEAVKEAEAAPVPAPEDIFQYVFNEMTPPLKEQLEYLKTTFRVDNHPMVSTNDQRITNVIITKIPNEEKEQGWLGHWIIGVYLGFGVGR